MKPINFEEQTTIAAKDQPEYRPLPAMVKPGPHGEVVSCWGLSFAERIKILFTGRIWMSLWMFRNANGELNPITPSSLTANKSDVMTVMGINFDALQSALREAKKNFPEGMDLLIIIHDDLYNSKGVDIPIAEERLATTILSYSDASKHVELPKTFLAENFIIVESFFK